ncbi:MAG: L,D-transpeptidase family protein [Gammaproteobacteria bacterium]|nr:L,D-transpeptidase family protein [Gammaproteobacteria bacterium]
MEELLFGGNLEIDGAEILARELLPELYAARNFQPLWTRPGRLDSLIELLETAPAHGLDPEDYVVDHLQTARAQAASGGSLDQADLDILATEAFVRFGYHQRFGKVNPQNLDANINFRRDLVDDQEPIESIQALIASERPIRDVIDEFFARGAYYRGAQQVLAAYREIEAAGGWPAVTAGATLREGDDDPRVAEMRRRLAATGDLPAGADLDSTRYNADVVAAVRVFQERHVLDADGIAGAQTVAAMNVPVQTRIDQLRLTLERLRWVQQEISPEFLAVNIAGFRTFLFRDGDDIWETRVMVGRPYRQTPVFRGDIRYLEFNPTWTIPPGILRNDVLPAIKRDPNYLRDRNISVIDRDGRKVDPATVDWNKYTRGVPYTLRQEPGPDNALGLIKFIFPNEHFVFLHDTPSRALFGRSERTFSSGCIRVENPFELAELLLNDAERWDADAIQNVVDSRQTRRVNLQEKFPVLIFYLTAVVDPKEPPRFMKDVYNRDPALLEALNGDVEIDIPVAAAN